MVNLGKYTILGSSVFFVWWTLNLAFQCFRMEGSINGAINTPGQIGTRFVEHVWRPGHGRKFQIRHCNEHWSTSMDTCSNFIIFLLPSSSSLSKRPPALSQHWLVVSTHLKKISQIGSDSPGRDENKKYLKPPPRTCHFVGFQRHLATRNPRRLLGAYCLWRASVKSWQLGEVHCNDLGDYQCHRNYHVTLPSQKKDLLFQSPFFWGGMLVSQHQ